MCKYLIHTGWIDVCTPPRPSRRLYVRLYKGCWWWWWWCHLCIPYVHGIPCVRGLACVSARRKIGVNTIYLCLFIPILGESFLSRAVYTAEGRVRRLPAGSRVVGGVVGGDTSALSASTLFYTLYLLSELPRPRNGCAPLPGLFRWMFKQYGCNWVSREARAI